MSKLYSCQNTHKVSVNKIWITLCIASRNQTWLWPPQASPRNTKQMRSKAEAQLQSVGVLHCALVYPLENSVKALRFRVVWRKVGFEINKLEIWKLKIAMHPAQSSFILLRFWVIHLHIIHLEVL